MKRVLILFGVWLCLWPAMAGAQHKETGVTISAPWARATAGKVGGVFMMLSTALPGGDRLVSGSSPVAGKVELHTTIKDGDIMRMRQVNAIDIKPGPPVELKPGGLHMMLIDLKAPLKEGQRVPLTLTFEKAGPVAVEVEVKAAGAMGGVGGHSHAPTPGGSGMDDRAAITAAMKKTWDRPNAPLRVVPVTVKGDTAVAGWMQGDMGGRALLRQHHGTWRLVLCAGDALTQAAFLREAGLSEADARDLAKAVVAAEAKLKPAERSLLAKFEGTVMMDEEGNHPPGHGAHGHGSQGGGHGAKH